MDELELGEEAAIMTAAGERPNLNAKPSRSNRDGYCLCWNWLRGEPASNINN